MGLSVHDPFVDPLGNPLGLERSGGVSEYQALLSQPMIVSILSPNTDYPIPKGYKFYRVTVVGKGGNGGSGTGQKGGGGGGLARSKIIPVSGRSVTVKLSTIAGDVFAEFADYLMVGRAGKNGGSAVAAGGIGEGGDYNFKGGDGSLASGGGAAGTMGNGGNSGVSGTLDGGGGGSIFSSMGYGGGGVGAPGQCIPDSRSTFPGYSNYWGGTTVDSTANSSYGGQWGGGGGTVSNASTGLNTGGAGGVRIELW